MGGRFRRAKCRVEQRLDNRRVQSRGEQRLLYHQGLGGGAGVWDNHKREPVGSQQSLRKALQAPHPPTNPCIGDDTTRVVVGQEVATLPL